jgi:hypothetical protein
MARWDRLHRSAQARNFQRLTDPSELSRLRAIEYYGDQAMLTVEVATL